MSDAYVIEVHSQTVGIVVRDGRKFCFFAATHHFNAFEGQVFASPKDAEKTLRRYATEHGDGATA